MSEMTRRNFLGTAGAMSAAALAGGGLVVSAMADEAPEDQGEATETEAAGDATASASVQIGDGGTGGLQAAQGEQVYSARVSGSERFAIAPAKASELGEPDETCDWLVVGAGNTGLFGAIHGLELGMDTILLEKSEYTGGGGAGTEATQLFNDSKYLQESGSPCGTSEEVYHYFQMQNAWLSDGLLVSNYIKHNHGPHDWLYDHGMGIVFCASGGVEAPVGGIMYEGMGSGVNSFVTKTFEEEGGRLFTSTGATKLVVDDEGAVVGVLADSPDKKDMYISAKNVFLGTGGFGTNPEMVDYYIGQTGNLAYKRDEQVGIPHDGDGIRMAMGVGAVESSAMWAVAPGQGSPANPEHDPWDGEVDRACREANLWVNERGKRIGNEKWDAISSNWGTAYRQNTGCYWNVFDAAAVERMETEPFVMGSRWVIAPEGDGDPMPNMGQVLDEAVGQGSVWKGETIEELAESAGIDPAGLVATVEHYNEMCRAGEDTDFYKDPACMNEIAMGPFYAIKVVGTWFSTLCGVKVDEDLRVLDVHGYPIKGLYAGGADCSEFFMTEYSHGFGGSCSAFSYFCGWYAAEVAQASLQ